MAAQRGYEGRVFFVECVVERDEFEDDAAKRPSDIPTLGTAVQRGTRGEEERCRLGGTRGER